ncbi:MAG TPA: protein-methionine-sulfoxide reductase heme-binding subunit MsrQ [Candidatus Limnocylindrales bacterium]|nr:protein-methionine-sulfoxide reductase heme-binding subunit MsrQ [Candidatus Limnocylindrales bacterium]
MTRRGRIVLKVAVWAACLTPLARLAHRTWHDALGANPISELTNNLGGWAFDILLASLAMTPLRILLGVSWPVSLRRLLGLFAFAYAGLHFLVWVVLDQYFDWPSMFKDIVKRPYITVGMAALTLLIPLATTSTTAMIRRLGGRNWQRLHRLAYGAGVLAALHFLWLAKKGRTDQYYHAAILAVLLGIRVWDWGRRRLARLRPAPAAPAPARGKSSRSGAQSS